MGILRFWLAALVVFAHLPGALFWTPSGEVAVLGFFTVSGFYIQLITGQYREANATHWIRNFYASRFWRLGPLYYLAAGLTILFWVITRADVPVWHLLTDPVSRITKAIVFFSNSFVIGLDLLRFTGIEPQTAHLFLADYNTLPLRQWSSGLAVLGQAWSLALEIEFYLLAPFLLFRKNWLLIVILLASFELKTVLWFYGLSHGVNWHSAFLPAVIWLFLAGSLAYRVYEWLLPRLQRHEDLVRGIGYGALVSLIAFSCLPIWREDMTWERVFLKEQFFVMLIIGALPFLFHASKNSRIDKFIGQLSYPIYLFHLLFIYLFDRYIGIREGWILALYSIAVIAFSALMAYYVDEPITRWRHRHFRKSRTLLPQIKE